MTIIKSKFKSYCYTCYYTIWQGELIDFNGKANHINCLAAIRDESPRQINPKYVSLFKGLRRNELKKLIEDKLSKSPRTVGAGDQSSNSKGRGKKVTATKLAKNESAKNKRLIESGETYRAHKPSDWKR